MLSGKRLAKFTAKFLVALFVLSCVARAHPWRRHAHQNHPHAESASNPSIAYQLDRDLISDHVTLESNGVEKRLSIRFGNLRRQQVGFTTQTEDSGNLVAGDIDRDGDIDLIWCGTAPQKSAVILLNQGKGDFAEVSDSSPYTGELDELFNIGDPPNQRLVKHRRKNASLPSPSFSDIAPGLEIQFQVPTANGDPIVVVAPVADQLALLASVPQRGPPPILS